MKKFYAILCLAIASLTQLQASPQALGLQVFQGILALGSPQSNKLKPLN